LIALPPTPQPQLRCCTASGCRSAGGEELLLALRRAATDAAAGSPQPPEGPLPIKAVGCLRLCGQGPLVACDGQQGTRLYGGLRPEQSAALLALALDGAAAAPAQEGHGEAAPQVPIGRPGSSSAQMDDQRHDHHQEQEQAVAALERQRLDLQQPFFALQRPLVLEHCGLIDPDSLEEAMERGAYSQLQRCLRELSPEQVRAEIRRSGLRGRGGAGYPTGLKWDTVALQPEGPRYVVCNADEGDPGAFMNRSVLEGDPHRLLEGIAIAAYAIGAERGYVYVRAEYPLAIARMRRALEQARSRGLFGSGPAAGAFRLDLELRVGAGAYVCGEETALLASIQGRRGMPKPRPPFPAQAGLWGAPTLINNVETLASVPVILRLGGEAYAAIGSPSSPGTKVFALSGAVRHTGLVEVPLGTSLQTIVETIGGGALDQPGLAGGGTLKAVQTGGPSGGCIPADQLDTPVDYESLRALGAMMGSGGMVVIDSGTPMPLLARHFMAFSVSESCGKCVPCRAGTVQLAALLDRFVEHRAEPADLQRLEQLCAMVRDTSLCGLGQAAPSPVLSTLRWFRSEYEAGIAASAGITARAGEAAP
jgi:bidirectional [NiFe] hydrogenase diaphorase subunit